MSKGQGMLTMPHYCIAYGCNNKQGCCKYSFIAFQRIQEERNLEAAIRVGWHATEYSRLCGAHL